MPSAASHAGKNWSKKYPPAKDIDTFIRHSPKVAQPKLKQLRALIRSVAPNADESISYRMPVFKLNGKGLVGFAGFERHIGFYPMSGSFLGTFKTELKEYKTSSGAVQFPLDQPLPVALIKKLVKARLAELR
jgi:uncharacterized protein YdhG (YjbR/CyaY superfamily)